MARATTKKKAAPKKKAVRRKSTGKELMTMEQMEKRMAEKAAAQSERESLSAGNTISTRNGKFTFQGTNLGTSMEVIVLDFSHARAYYDSDFDPDELRSPACFALSMDGEDMAPHEDSPAMACDGLCSECEFDAWGSAEKGDGKRCKEQRRLALLSAEDDLEQAAVAFVSIPSGSLKNWKGFLKKVEKQLHRPCYGVVAKIFFDPDAEYDVIDFEVMEKISSVKELTIIEERASQVEEDLMRPYDTEHYSPPSVKKSRGRGRAAPKKKATAKKKGSKFSR